MGGKKIHNMYSQRLMCQEPGCNNPGINSSRNYCRSCYEKKGYEGIPVATTPFKKDEFGHQVRLHGDPDVIREIENGRRAKSKVVGI